MSQTPPSSPDPGIALSLGSAFLGYYAHAGLLNELNEQGIYPGKICGSSAGALAAGLYAAGIQGEDLKEMVMAPSFKRAFLDGGFLYRWIPMLVWGHPGGLFSGQGMVKLLENHLPVKDIQDCSTADLAIAVSNLRDQETPMLDSGPLAQAIVASCAVPILFQGQEIDGKHYLDGGILHETPIEHYFSDPEIHTIIIHRVNYPSATTKRRFFLHNLFTSSHAMFSSAITAYREKEAERLGKRLIFLDTHHPHPGPFQSLSRKNAFYEAGRATIAKESTRLENLKNPS